VARYRTGMTVATVGLAWLIVCAALQVAGQPDRSLTVVRVVVGGAIFIAGYLTAVYGHPDSSPHEE